MQGEKESRQLLPQERDIVVSRESTADSTWEIRGYLGPAALSTTSRDRAIQLARVMAKEMTVDVWTFDGQDYGLVVRGRRLPASRRQSAYSG